MLSYPTPPRGGGLYLIRLSDTHFYGGRARSFCARWAAHLRGLERGCHPNLYMQRVFNEYGRFEPEVLARLASGGAPEAEQLWLDANYGLPGCVNLSRAASGGCGPHTEVTKAKLQEAWKKRRQVPVSAETRLKQSEARRGIARPGVGKGRSLSEEHKKRLSESLQGQIRSEEARQRMSVARRGVPLSKEHRERLSLTRIGRRWVTSPGGETRFATPAEADPLLQEGWQFGRPSRSGRG